MSIVATEIESRHGTPPQMLVFYRCQDSEGAWHRYGPVIVNDQTWDADAAKVWVSEKVAAALAEQEALALLGSA